MSSCTGLLALEQLRELRNENDAVVPIESEYHDKSDTLKDYRPVLDEPGVLMRTMECNGGMDWGGQRRCMYAMKSMACQVQ